MAIPASVSTIGESAFLLCNSLTAIDVNGGNANYSSVGGVLYDKAIATLIQCPSGRSDAITVPGSVTFIANEAFYHCTVLSTVTIPSSVTSIGDGAFSYCRSLTSVIMPVGINSIADSLFIGAAL